MTIASLLDNDAPLLAKLVSERELMAMLRLSRTTVWRLRTKGLPTVTVGRTIRYNIERVQQWLEQTNASLDTDQARESRDPSFDVGNSLPDCHWSLSVAMDPKHRPQEPHRPASTVRREWWRYPQEAHLLDRTRARYRRLTAEEIGRLQGFPPGWGTAATKDELLLIRGYGDAVPPPLAEQLMKALPMLGPPRGIRTSVEICAGFGGLALGKSRALEVEHLALLERWPVACEVLRTCGAFPMERVQEVDLNAYNWGELAGKVDLLSGGPPCQPWSLAGRGLGEADERDLLGKMPGAVAALRPAVFVFENVLGLLSGENETYARDLIDRLRNCAGPNSYGVAMAVLNAADFGVPQTRRRVFIVGAAGHGTSDILRFFDRVHAEKTHADPRHAAQRGLAAWKTVASAIPDWQAPKRQWYRWPQTPEQAFDNEMMDPSEIPGGTAVDSLPRRRIRVGLDWPSRGLKAMQNEEGDWVIKEEREEAGGASLFPLLPVRDTGRPLDDPWYVRGDPMTTLEGLRRALGKRASLAYLDIPRIRTNAGSFDAAERESLVDTWLTVVHGLLRRAYSLLDDDGALVALCGIEETHFVRLLLDEIAGPGNHLGTIAWQKNYSARNMPNMREVSPTHDNVILFARRIDSMPPLALKRPPDGFSNRDGDPRGPWKAEQKGANKPDCDYEVNICPYRWEITSGQLPPGIWRLNPKSGVIWGSGQNLTATGCWKFTVRVTDSAGQTAEREFEIRIDSEAPAPAPASIPWLESAAGLDASGRLRFVTRDLPIARQGANYSACLVAAGGKPWVGTTRPGKTAAEGKGRYWEFPLKTLVLAASEDRVDFKSSDRAIPAIKTYLNGAQYTPLNQTSVWLGSSKGPDADAKNLNDVGYSQDAKKELEVLLKSGAIGATVGISKPARLMTRLLALVDRKDGLIIDVGSPAAEMASIATAMGRQAVYVELKANEDLRSGLLLRRLTLSARGRHPLPDVVDFLDSPATANGTASGYFVLGSRRAEQDGVRPYELMTGPAFALADRAADACYIDYVSYPEESPAFLWALSSLEGLIAFAEKRDDGAFAATVGGGLVAVHIPSSSKLDAGYLDKLLPPFQSHFEGGGRLRIYYHRGGVPSDHEDAARLELRRIPYDLKFSAGMN